jgi:hypothetical protein
VFSNIRHKISRSGIIQLGSDLQSHFTKIMAELLAVDLHQRSSPPTLRQLFESYLPLLDISMEPCLQGCIPSYREWLLLLQRHSTGQDFYCHLGPRVSTRFLQSVFGRKLVERWPQHPVFFRRLVAAQSRHGYVDTDGSFWDALGRKYPNKAEFSHQSELAHRKEIEIDQSIAAWVDLIARYPLQRKFLFEIGNDAGTERRY